MKPDVLFTWASDNGVHLDNVKLEKTLNLFPFVVTASARYNLHSKTFHHKLSCKDIIVKGKFTVDPSEKSIDYRKRFNLPGLGSKFGALVASARWVFSDVTQSWNPTFRVGFEFRQGGAEMVHLNAVRFKPKLFYKHVGLEARTLLTMSLPSRLLFDVPRGGPSVVVPEDEDGVGINLELQRLDLVVRL